MKKNSCVLMLLLLFLLLLLLLCCGGATACAGTCIGARLPVTHLVPALPLLVEKREDELQVELSAVGRQGGSTASVFLIHRSGLAVAGNVGDSSILLIEVCEPRNCCAAPRSVVDWGDLALTKFVCIQHSEEPVFSASVSPACETGISRVYAAVEDSSFLFLFQEVW